MTPRLPCVCWLRRVCCRDARAARCCSYALLARSFVDSDIRRRDAHPRRVHDCRRFVEAQIEATLLRRARHSAKSPTSAAALRLKGGSSALSSPSRVSVGAPRPAVTVSLAQQLAVPPPGTCAQQRWRERHPETLV